MELKNILIIEDDSTLRDTVIGEFQAKDVEIQACEPDNLDHFLATFPKVQLVILDWLLYGDSSDLAKVCLKKIRQAYFVPVIVWTAELSVFENEIEDVKKIFPEACLHAESKSNISYQELLDFLVKWHEGTPAKLSEQLRQSITTSVEESLYKLAEHSEDDLARGLKTLISLGDRNEIDMEHAVDVLLRLVARAIYGDEDFMETVRQTVEKLERAPDKAKKIESRIKKLHMYYRPRDNFVRTGDIVKITFELEQKNKQMDGIVITPACDLAQPGKTTFLRLGLIHGRADITRKSGEDKWDLDKENKLEVCFHEILVIENLNLAGAEGKKQVMTYNHTYQSLSGIKVTLVREQRLDEPYRADLLQRFISHAGRIGVPDFEAPA